MEKQPTKAMQLFQVIGAIIGWFAIVVQLYLLIVNRVTSVPEVIIRFFSYFTILTNILAASCFTVLLLKPKSKWIKFFYSARTLTAVTVYIIVVGIVYNIILRFLWAPEGLQMIVDEILHLVLPVFFVLYWILFVPKDNLQWKNAFLWLVYPVVYFLFIMIRGEFSGFYPYPFIDVSTLGYYKVLLNAGGVLIGFLSLGFLFVIIARIISKRAR